ncbi:serine/threonine-protein kinase [Pelomonas sp. SE-A7]|uniref:serine/threonine protein kinase n=1 Tax=Pelomonas sp. SE-A7 TaxID=3054953 RepID=UPI00259CE783|nr:serine/threonine-protein kinase [Pelomonas sp. SE-A7]MDM4768188.1 protein kinase [Pelomonas sp. SE-A7]
MTDASNPDRSQIPGNPPEDEFNALASGTRFGELEILRTLGIGGFGIVYLAQDHALERLVAIKEYMPGQLAKRSEGSHVSVRSGSLAETFDLGRRSFVNEARLLARFDHRSLLKVYRFWEANGTAYMVMPYLQGQTLKQARQGMTEPPAEAWIMKRLLPLLDGLALLHTEHVYHRDIAPDNILLPLDEADPILLDFGAARRAISDKTQSFTAILKPSYAPIEQYAEAAALRQGPWTDIYAMAAVLHYLVMGHTPPPSTTRTVADEYQPLAERGLPGYSEHFLAAIDWALGVRPQDRPQSMREFRAALQGEIKPPESRYHYDPDRTIIAPRGAQAYEATQLIPDATTQVDASKALPPVVPPAPPPASPAPVPLPVPAPKAQPAAGPDKRQGPLLVGVAVLVLLVAGSWLIWGRGESGGKKPVESPSTAVSVPALRAEPASAPGSLAVQTAKVQAPAASIPVSSVPTAPAKQPPASSPAPRPAENKANGRSDSAKPAPAKDKPPLAPLPSMPKQDPSLSQPVTTAPTASTVNAAPSQAASRPAEAASGPPDPLVACGHKKTGALGALPDSFNLPLMACLERTCRKADYQAHGECAKIRELIEKRDGRF